MQPDMLSRADLNSGADEAPGCLAGAKKARTSVSASRCGIPSPQDILSSGSDGTPFFPARIEGLRRKQLRSRSPQSRCPIVGLLRQTVNCRTLEGTPLAGSLHVLPAWLDKNFVRLRQTVPSRFAFCQSVPALHRTPSLPAPGFQQRQPHKLASSMSRKMGSFGLRKPSQFDSNLLIIIGLRLILIGFVRLSLATAEPNLVLIVNSGRTSQPYEPFSLLRESVVRPFRKTCTTGRTGGVACESKHRRRAPAALLPRRRRRSCFRNRIIKDRSHRFSQTQFTTELSEAGALLQNPAAPT